MEEKENLTKMIEDIDHGNKVLTEKLTSYKFKEVDWTNKEKTLNKKLKILEEQITITNNQNNKLSNNLELLSFSENEKMKELGEMSR